MRFVSVLALVALAGCVSSARVHRLETRLAAAEAAQAKAEFEQHNAMTRVEALLERLAGAVGELTEANRQADDLADQVAALQAKLAAQPAAPPRPKRSGPDPTKVYGVPIGQAPVRGKATALVTIIRAGEYACPFCEKVRPTLDQIVATYGDQVRIVYRTFIVHPQVATYAARAACAAHRQGRFWDMDKVLWDETFLKREFEPTQIDALAARIGLNPQRFLADVTGVCVGLVEADQAELTKFGVGATPVFFVNGRFLSGAQPFSAFAALIDVELDKAKAVVKTGVKPARYYEQEIVNKGLPSL